jgi:hypothetical protein
MDKNYITNNWEKFYKNYAKHNPDLLLNGISTKRALLNHYIRYGINENRKIFDNDNIIITNNDNITNNDYTSITNNNNISITNNEIDIIKENIFQLNEIMIIEKLDN